MTRRNGDWPIQRGSASIMRAFKRPLEDASKMVCTDSLYIKGIGRKSLQALMLMLGKEGLSFSCGCNGTNRCYRWKYDARDCFERAREGYAEGARKRKALRDDVTQERDRLRAENIRLRERVSKLEKGLL